MAGISNNQERNAEILRRLETRRPFEVAKDLGISRTVVAGVLWRHRNRRSLQDGRDKEDEFWAQIDALPDPPWTSDEADVVAVAALRSMIKNQK